MPIDKEFYNFIQRQCIPVEFTSEYTFDCNGHLVEAKATRVEKEPSGYVLPEIKRIVFNPPATIVFWADGDKTVAKCMDGQKFEEYAGFSAACMKKMFGSTSNAMAVMDSVSVVQTNKVTKTVKNAAKALDVLSCAAKKFREQFLAADIQNAIAEIDRVEKSSCLPEEIQEAVNETLGS